MIEYLQVEKEEQLEAEGFSLQTNAGGNVQGDSPMSDDWELVEEEPDGVSPLLGCLIVNMLLMVCYAAASTDGLGSCELMDGLTLDGDARLCIKNVWSPPKEGERKDWKLF